MLFAEKWHTAPFDVLEKDIDDFILVANYMIGLGKESKNENKSISKNKQQRIKVNDKTASDGWW